MTDEKDYQKMYDDLKTESESKIATMENDIAELTKGLDERDKKISELQTYICKNLTSPENPNRNAGGDDFIDKYKAAINENKKG